MRSYFSMFLSILNFFLKIVHIKTQFMYGGEVVRKYRKDTESKRYLSKVGVSVFELIGRKLNRYFNLEIFLQLYYPILITNKKL